MLQRKDLRPPYGKYERIAEKHGISLWIHYTPLAYCQYKTGDQARAYGYLPAVDWNSTNKMNLAQNNLKAIESKQLNSAKNSLTKPTKSDLANKAHDEETALEQAEFLHASRQQRSRLKGIGIGSFKGSIQNHSWWRPGSHVFNAEEYEKHAKQFRRFN